MLKMSSALTALACLISFAGQSIGEEWPTYRNDHFRSGIVNVVDSPKKLEQAWTWKSELPPDPAWDGPARWDAFAQIRDLPAMRQYDACFHPVSDGQNVYFGSSSQDTLFALDLQTGQPIWQFVAGGPIRLAPTLDEDRVLFGCDDGYAYCLNKSTGELIWKFNPSEDQNAEQRRLINNDRLISYYPIRTGVTVRDGVAYFGASFLPWRESYLCAVDVETGKQTDSNRMFVTKKEKATLEGNLLVADNRLIVPQGRIAPSLFDRTNGKSLGSLPGGGGVTVVLTEQGEVIRAEGGRQSRPGQVGVFKGKERVASFPRGRAMVVTNDDFFVIDGQKLFAAGRETNELKWSRAVDEPLEIILVGKTLFVSGRDHVTAVDSENGNVLWSANTEGRAFGILYCNDQLLVSTDQGVIHCYRKVDQASESPPVSKNKQWKSPSVPRVRERNLIHRWVFHRSAMKAAKQNDLESTSLTNVEVKDHASNLNLKLQGSATAIQINESRKLEAIELAGGMFPIATQAITGLPRKSISVESWVRVDETQRWGGVVGCIQDDGATEHGWVLGFQNDKFSFGLAGGRKGMTYLPSNETFELGSWNHVVGTYDGSELRLYVNGSLAANSREEQGEINYSPDCHFTVGAYHDANELYPLNGAVQELRIYSKALAPDEIATHFEAKKAEFRIVSKTGNAETKSFLTWGPYVRFIQPGRAEISFGTAKPTPSVVDLITESEVRRIADDQRTTEHKIVLRDLPYKRELQYQIFDGSSKSARSTVAHPLDTHFDWTEAKQDSEVVIKEDPFNAIVIQNLVDKSPNPRGIALVIGSEKADYAKSLSRHSDFNVVLVEEDKTKAASLRQKWSNEPETIYGRRLCVTDSHIGELPAATAALVVTSKESVRTRRLARPGGIVSTGEAVTWKRSDIEGCGEWSHMYGSADNSAFGGESLSNASDRAQLVTQWIGRPGPRYQTDRQNRKPSPLAVGGRMFLQGQQRMIALDSYSGTVLWSVESPTVMRWNVPRDCGNWCADKNSLYVAAESQAWVINGRDGQLKRKLDVPSKSETRSSKSKLHWGYIAIHDDQLIGTSVQADAIYTKWWGKTQWFDTTGGDDTHAVVSEKLFSMNPESGELNWQYDGLALHPTITIMDETITFIEDKTKEHLASPNRRVPMNEKGIFEIVRLNIKTGKELWRHPLPKFKGHVASLYLAGGGEEEVRSLIMVASESTAKEFTVSAYTPDNGETKWTQGIVWESTHHGKHIARPAIQGDLVYIRPEVLKLANGESIHRGFPSGHGCSSYTACTNGIFSRLGETTWWDVRTQKVNRFERIRTDCWVSVIPAQGMVLSAEGGGGCSCGTWLETSLGLLPRSVDEALPEK